MESDVRLLLVEDSPEDERVLLHVLRSGGLPVVCQRVDDEASLVRALEGPWDLVITDYFLPSLTGDRVLEVVRDRWPHLAVIVLSGRVGEDLAVEMMHRGASDYILKDNLGRVPFAIERLLRETRIRQARARAEAQVLRLGRMYRILSETNQAIVRVSDPLELLQEVCRSASRWGPFDRVRVTQGKGPVLVTAAEAGEGAAPPFFWEKHVLDTGRMVVNNDLGQGGSVPFGDWESAALYPLWVGGSVWGCLAFYARRRGVFTPEEASLLQELSEDLGFGLQARTQDRQRRETEQFLSDMTTLVPGLVFKLRWKPGDGLAFLYASPGLDLLLPHLTPARILADPGLVFRAFHPQDRKRFHRAALRSRDFLTVFSLEFRLLRPNGAVVWVLATAFPQKAEDGSVVWTGMAIDVTPQNKLQVDLQREQELLAVILENIGDGVVAIDDQGQLAVVNQAASRLLDRAPGPVGGPWTDLDPDLPWASDGTFRPWFRRRADGTVLHLEVHGTDLQVPGQAPRGRVLLLRDMTERDRIEDRLRQSEKLESIGLLSGGIAHDFNNLLTGIFGFIQLARMNADQSERVTSYLDHALGPFHRARTLTQQLLSFAKDGEPAKAPHRLPELLPELLRFTLGGSSVDWDLRAPEDLWPVVANEAQLHQVFENLFLNARQAMVHGGQLTVTLANVEAPGPEGRGLEPGPYVEALVADNGPGMDPEVLAKVFDPFFTTKASGTGLGLSICFSVVKKHHGTIEADSRPGAGASFRLFWPASPATPGGAAAG